MVLMEAYLFVNREEVSKFKAGNKIVNFSIQYCFGSMSNRFVAAESREASWKWNVYVFSVDYNDIDKYGILKLTSI